MFETTYTLTLARTYVSSWGLHEAVREIIQNALDCNSPFVYSFAPQETDPSLITLTVSSEFETLSAKTLLLGASSKASNPDTIGNFGEGFKLALLVLTRLGYPVTVMNGNVNWTPEFRHDKRFGEELLVIKETKPVKPNRGLSFLIEGLSAEDAESLCSVSLKMQSEVGKIVTTQYGNILLDKPGELYVGSLFICNTDFKFGYDANPSELTLERDRQTVSGWNLADLSRRMWLDSKQWNFIAEEIEAKVSDFQLLEYGSPELVKEACYKLFIAKNPGKVAVKSQEEMEEAVKAGMTNTVYIGNSNFYYQVSNYAPHQTAYEAAKKTVIPPEQLLKDWFEANRKYMRTHAIVSFKVVLKQAEDWKLR